jgi:FSR family fosmidomycin resistance protein-like MFS transporter
VFGAREAAWPLIRSDLGLSYFQIGVILTVPNMIGSLVEPGLFVLGDTGHRRRIILGGGVAFATALAGFALAGNYALLLVACALLAPASGAFVSLSQASLMDLEPGAHERNMARWVAAGAVGVVAGPLLVAGAVGLHVSWRVLMFGLAVGSIPFVLAARRVRIYPVGDGLTFRQLARGAVAAFRDPAVLRWLVILQLTDLMGDILFGFLALYFVDVVHQSVAVAGLAVFAWSAAGLAGDLLLVWVLDHMDGIRYLRLSALATALVFPAFLLSDGLWTKFVLVAGLGLLRAGWYAIPQGRLFTALSGRSGTAIALSSLADLAGRFSPIAIGALAGRFGLGPAMWALMLAPAALLIGLPRAEGPVNRVR